MSSLIGPGEPAPAPPAALVAVDASTARSSVVLSGSFLVSSLLGGLLAVLIALIVGEGADTDAFLAAYSVYLVFTLFGSTLRVALVPLLGPTSDEQAFTRAARERVKRLLAAAAVLALTILVLSPLLGRVLVPGAGSDAQLTAGVSVGILAIAAFFQVWAAALSAVLGAARRFMWSALLYIGSSAANVALAAVLMAVIGIEGAALGLLGGALLLVAGHVLYMRRFGFRAWPHPRSALESSTWRLAGLAAAGASIPIGFQVNLTISLAAVSDQTGAVTAYTYAYFLTVLATSITAATIGLVTMPGLVSALHERGRSAAREYMQATSPIAVFLYVPLAVAFAVFGKPFLDAVLEGALTPGTIDLLWDAARIFLLMGLAWVLLAPLTTLALALELYGTMALLTLCMIPVHAALVLPASSEGPLATVAAHAVSGTLLVVALLVIIFRREAAAAAARTIVASLPAAGLALSFVVLGLLGLGDGGVLKAAAGVLLAAALYVALAAALWPSVGRRTLLQLTSRT